ncbi:caspase family protein [Crocinitomicaceae bacterium]|nr:caspase family protein [Crocinitomicaceae bacterium]
MKFTALIFLSILYSGIINAQEKHALLVGISEYKNFPKAQPLSSSRDMILVEQMLEKQKFNESKIIKLYEENATYDAMHNAFKSLLDQVASGDIVYYHFSGHGCQIMDVGDIDENDGYDEAMMPYDVSPDEMKGFFTDDEFNYYLNRLREKLGGDGQIVVMMDCCHSGTGTRDLGSKKVSRGFTEPFAPKGYKPKVTEINTWSDMDNKHELQNELASLTSYYGCRASQVNYEYYSHADENYYGSLTYFFIEALNHLDEAATHNNLYTKMNQLHQQRKDRNNSQNMLYESDDKNTLIFNGEFLAQKNFLSLSKLTKSSATIDAGSIHGLIVGDTIGFFENTEMTFDMNSVLFKGVVQSASISSSEVSLLSFRNAVNKGEYLEYRARKIGNATSNLKINVKLCINKKRQLKMMKEYLTSDALTEVVDNDFDILIQDTLIDSKSHLVLRLPNGLILRDHDPIAMYEGNEDFACLKNQIQNEISIKYFIESQSRIDHPDVKVDVRIKGIDSIKKSGEAFNLIISNKSDFSIYWNLIMIEPNHSISPDKDDWISPVPIARGGQWSPPSKWSFDCENGTTCGEGRIIFLFSNEEIKNYDAILDLTKCDTRFVNTGNKRKMKFETQEFLYHIVK